MSRLTWKRGALLLHRRAELRRAAPRTMGAQWGDWHAMSDEKRCRRSTSDLGQAKAPTLVDTACQMVFRLGFPLARIWWRLLRPRHDGALVAIHVGQSLLLLRSSYQSAWTFPGGGIRKGETPEVAARRELAEEIGLVVPNVPLHPVGEVCGGWDGRRTRVFLFLLRSDELPILRLDNREIIGAQLVPIEDLHKVPMTGPVEAYFRGQYSPIGASS